MPKIRVATFNIENLLHRFDFYRYGRLVNVPALQVLNVADDDEGMLLRKSLFVAQTDDTRQMTAQAIRDTDADIVCLQEVDNKAVLDDFHDFYLERSTNVHYGWRRVLEGNDRRGIDVGVLAKSYIKVKSNKHHTFHDFDLFNDALRNYGLSEGDPIFRRDCLEVDCKVDGKELTIFVCHFKSMSGGREHTRVVREAEAKAVRMLVEERFGDDLREANWLVVGDLNDYTEPGHGLGALLDGNFCENLVERLPAEERWTHYYPREPTPHQLDYILASPAIAAATPDDDEHRPTIIRSGQPHRVPGLDSVKRYARVGFDRPKASDHCPVAITIELA